MPLIEIVTLALASGFPLISFNRYCAWFPYSSAIGIFDDDSIFEPEEASLYVNEVSESKLTSSLF